MKETIESSVKKVRKTTDIGVDEDEADTEWTYNLEGFVDGVKAKVTVKVARKLPVLPGDRVQVRLATSTDQTTLTGGEAE